MKKLITLLWVICFPLFSYANKENLNIQITQPSGEYSSVIEIHLKATEDVNKVFYYTDWIWNLDNIYMYDKPIIIKSDTELSYYWLGKDYNATKIESKNYTFNYSEEISITHKKNYIIIKNNSKKSVNLGYWTISWEKTVFEFEKNTILNSKKSMKIPYNIEYWEKIELKSPDEKVKDEFNEPNLHLRDKSNIEITKNWKELVYKKIIKKDNSLKKKK